MKSEKVIKEIKLALEKRFDERKKEECDNIHIKRKFKELFKDREPCGRCHIMSILSAQIYILNKVLK